ncbi:MAG TPA: hypothetical protein VJ867_11955 [Gemmatimonadaceae bacterium]|nr:hypothetical protein [Gemmatimonadaceae bacterium]
MTRAHNWAIVVVLSLFHVLPASAEAQRVGASAVAVTTAGAVAGGALGAVAGGTLGLLIGSGCDSGGTDRCDVRDLSVVGIGILTGITVGAPVGAHLADHRRGSLGHGLLASAAVLALEALTLNALHDPSSGGRNNGKIQAVLIATPLVQIALSAFVELQR